MKRFRPVLLPALLVAGCHEIPEAPLKINVALSASTAWSGGTVQLVSPQFSQLKAVPAVYLGSTQLTVTVVNDSTLSAALPRTTGTFEVWVSEGKVRADAGPLRLTGFRDTYDGPVFSGAPYWRVPGGPPDLIGNGNTGGAVFHLSTNTVEAIAPDSIESPDCTQGAGPTGAADAWVFSGMRGGTCYTAVWGLTPSLHLVDSIGGLAEGGGEAWWVMTQPSPSRWFYEWNNYTQFVDCSTGSCSAKYGRDRGGPWFSLISPQGNRFVNLPADFAATVYDANTLDTAYVVSQLSGATAGAYSPDGDTLYLAAMDSTNGWALVEQRSADGSVLRSLPLAGLAPGSDLIAAVGAVTPAWDHPWLYVILQTYTPSVGGHIALVVLDRTTLSVVGATDLPNGFSLNYYPTVLVPSPDERLVYLVSSYWGYNTHGLRPTVWRFDTP